jgi:trk system potassium uptake protein TrkH
MLMCLGAAMITVVPFSAYYAEGDLPALLMSLFITMGFGVALYFGLQDTGNELTHREGFAIVSLAWLAAGVFGGLPFLFSGTFHSPVDAIFESVSGFTTTGASVLTDIEKVPHGVRLWRDMTQWLGGMGIILLGVAILPLLGVGGMELYKAEVPGPVPDKIKPRVAETAKTLWLVYVLISALEVFLLYAGGMDMFESLCNTFGTMATGGFNPRNASIAYYNSVYSDVVITVFMFIAGANFALHYSMLRGSPGTYWRDPEFRFYLLLIVICTAAVTLQLRASTYDTIGTALRYASFQVTSIMTTTGFVTADYEKWPYFSQFLLLLLMFVGGCAGSTGGAIKCVRVLMLIKQGYRELYLLIHPHGVFPVKLGKKAVSHGIMNSVWGFSFFYLFIFGLSAMVMCMLGLDIVSAVSSVAATLGNVGPALGSVGPMDNYANVPWVGKWVLIVCMILGRLEIYTVIVLFVPECWKK